MKRLASLILVLCAVTGATAAAAQVETATTFADLAGHWAADLVEAWTALKLIAGYPDGTFRPDEPVDRAQFSALLCRVLALTDSATCPLADVPENAWYAGAIRKVVAAGCLAPADDGTVKPEAVLTRQEMASMLAHALGLPLEPNRAVLECFLDAAAVDPDYAPALAELVERAVIHGFPDTTLRPAEQTTRAEAVTLLARAFGTMYRSAGVHGPEGERESLPGGAAITAGGVTLRNLLVPGHLYVTAGSGEVCLKNVAVAGQIVIGGSAVLVLDGVEAGSVVVSGSGASLVTTGGSLVPEALVLLPDEGDAVQLAGDGFLWVVVHGPGRLKLDGLFGTVAVRGGRTRLELCGCEVGTLQIAAEAGGSEVTLAEGTVIEEFAAFGAAEVGGQGTIVRAGAFADGVVVGLQPEIVSVMPGHEAEIGGQVIAGEIAAHLEFDFSEGPDGWEGGFCDLPADYDPDQYLLEFGHADLPDGVGPGKGLFIGGSNLSDDLFMFVGRALGQAAGVLPNTTYNVQIEVDLATNAPAGAVGIGGAPGEALFVKVGAAPEEPRAVVEPAGGPGDPGGPEYLVLSVDKGAQNDEGRYAVQIGNAAKSSDEFEWSYEIKTMSNAGQPLTVTTGADGRLWVFAGTDSGFEGRTELYYARIAVTLGVMVTR